MKWYVLNKNYVKYLKQFDPIVPNIEYTGALKCFLGVVFKENGGINYFAPLTSYKPKFITMKNDIDFFKIVNSNGKIYGAIDINNMIPVPRTECNELTLNNLPNFRNFNNKREVRSYWKLLQTEMSFVNDNVILYNAEKLYRFVNQNPCSPLAQRCCNFPLLEEKCKEWEEVQNLLPSLQYIRNENDLFYIYDELVYKNNFEKIVRILDNSTDSKDITNIDIKDFENKIIKSTTILNYMIDEDTTIENFIKYNKEGNKLIPNNGNISTITLKNLNEVLTKENFKKIELPNNIKVNDNTTLLDLQNILDKQGIKFKSNGEEM